MSALPLRVALVVATALVSACDLEPHDRATLDEALLASDAGLEPALDADALDADTLDADTLDAGDDGVPEGSFVVTGAFESAPVLARPLPGRDDVVRIERYPAQVIVPLRHGLLPVGYEAAFSPAFCAEVRAIAEQSRLGEPFRAQALRLLRRGGSPVARLSLSPLVSPRFVADVRGSARAQGFALAAVQLDNPLVAREASIDLTLREDAIAALLGVASVRDALTNTLRMQRTHALAGGDLTLAIAGKDVWCDLASGAASLVLDVRADARGTPVQTTTRTRGVAPL